jgi:hypothetical protein
MRYDQILPRLVPNANYKFGYITESRLSRLPGDNVPIARDEEIAIRDTYDQIIWLDEVVEQPTLKECETEWARIQIELSDAAIDSQRRAEYGTIENQLDMIYWDKVNGTNLWETHITRVKTDNPKL